MTLTEATKLRDDYLNKLVGRHYDSDRPDWEIKDVIVSDKENAENVYTKMYNEKLSNESALTHFPIGDDSYDALIIAHQWPWGSNHMIVESVKNYLKTNAI